MVTGSAGLFHAFRMSLIRLTMFASYAAVWLRLHPSFQPWNLRNNGGQ